MDIRLMRFLDDDGSISPEGVETLKNAVKEAAKVIKKEGAESTLAIATSAIREAANGPEVLDELSKLAGVPIEVLSGADEARLTFLAARRWYGWGVGRLLVLDIGGGSLEIAAGTDELPDVAISIPLGAGRMTKKFLWENDPPTANEVADLKEYVRHKLGGALGNGRLLKGDHVVGTSKTFRSLARLAGMPRHPFGAGERYTMSLANLEDWVPRLCKLSSEDRVALPGIGPRRSRQIAAGAIVAMETMRALKIDQIEVCPWALREGVLLRHIESLGS
jgi:exopolyphosphatase/guanosine-5'-triphosphate,3'-diphosphate pyrophosphatase